MFKNMSIRLKITLWFAVALLIALSIIYFVIITISGQVINDSIRSSLVEGVGHNLSEVEYLNVVDAQNINEFDLYISHEGGFLELNSNFLDESNGVFTSLYDSDGNLLYGENPIEKQSFVLDFTDGEMQDINIDSIKYYVYDRKLDNTTESGLWIRGILSEHEGAQQIEAISRWSMIILPIIFILAVTGGYIIVSRLLKPLLRVTQAAKSIEQDGDLKKRLKVGGGKDEVHELANTFNSMIARLDESFDTQRRFTADASHELRTPTSVILAQTEFSLEKERTPNEYQRALRVVQRQGKKMANLINDMLDFTRLEMRTQEYDMFNLNLSELVSAICKDLALIKENDIEIKSNIEKDIYIVGNKELISRMLINLINNAYRYGKISGTTVVELSQDDKQIYLSVKDNGGGIEKEEIDKIFGRFYQSDSARSSQGAGLGLPMVKEIASLHHASIKVESKINHGSKFTIQFNK